MNYLAVDDEKFALEDLEETLRETQPNCTLFASSLPGEALEYAAKAPVDVAFLDIELGSTSGLLLAKKLKDLQPEIHIIFVTSHEQYAFHAIQLRATGYLMKPVTAEDIRRELTFLYGDPPSPHKIRVQTFGGFDVFIDGSPLQFKRAKTKELLAYLVDRRGVSVTIGTICAVLWEDEDSSVKKSYLRNLVADLRATLDGVGASNVLNKGFNCLSINPERLDCDSYRFLAGDPQAVNSYRHDYMPQYSWAEFSVGILEERL